MTDLRSSLMGSGSHHMHEAQ